MEIVRAAIGDFGVNTRHLQLCLEPVLGTELLLGEPALVFSQLGSVFGRVTGIAGFRTPTRDEQVFNAKVNSYCVRIDSQQFRDELAKAGHEVSTREVLGNRDGAGRRRQSSRPANVERFFALGNVDFAIRVFERARCEFSRLAKAFFLEGRISRPTRPEVLVGRLLVAKALLKRNGRDFIEISKLREFLDLRETGIRLEIVNLVLVFVELLRTPFQNRVVNLTNTAKRPCQQDCLLRCRVEPIFVSPFARLHDTEYSRC